MEISIYLLYFFSCFVSEGKSQCAEEGNWFFHSYIFSVIFQPFLIFTLLRTHQNVNSDNLVTTVLALIGGNNRPQTRNLVVSAQKLTFSVAYNYRTVYLHSGGVANLPMNSWIHYPGCMLSILTQSPGFSSDKASGTEEFQWSFANITILHITGVVLFIYGSCTQYQAHVGLANLRKGKDNQVVTMKHQIPKGGLFDLISCPNYWGEIVVYCAFSVLFGFKNYTWNCVVLWVASNQITSGIMNHKWYLETFPEYPKNRKAVIPYLL